MKEGGREGGEGEGGREETISHKVSLRHSGGMPDSQSRDPAFESPLLPFKSLSISFLSTMPQFTQLYK